MRSPTLFLLTLALFAAAGCSHEPGSLPEAGRELMACLRSGDAACVDRYISTEERNALALNRRKLERWLREYVVPNLKNLKEKHEPMNSAREGFGLIRSQAVERRDGRRFSLLVRVARTIDGIRSPRVVSGLTTFLMHARHAPRQQDSEEPGAYWDDLAEAAEKDVPLLQAMGIAGVYDDRSKQLVPWDRWIITCRMRAEDARRRRQEREAGRTST